MRVQIMRACGLGIPPRKQWTGKSIQYMLQEVYRKDTDDYDLTSKVDAAKILQDIIRKEGEQDDPEHIVRYENLAAQLEQKGEGELARTCRNLDHYEEVMSPSMEKVIKNLLEITELERTHSSSTQETDYTNAPTPRNLFRMDPQTKTAEYTNKRKELMEQTEKLQKQLRELDEPTAKRQRSVEALSDTTNELTNTQLQRNYGIETGSFGIQWMHPSGTRSNDRASTFLRQQPTLTGADDGWEQIINFSNTTEVVPLDHPLPTIRGLHFFTACAMAVKEIENLKQIRSFEPQKYYWIWGQLPKENFEKQHQRSKPPYIDLKI